MKPFNTVFVNPSTPSYVGFTDSESLIGDAAKNQVAMNPINTVFAWQETSFCLMIENASMLFPDVKSSVQHRFRTIFDNAISVDYAFRDDGEKGSREGRNDASLWSSSP
ncbi:hypothetical protein SASPL_155261 [Salvia splendens]|uniref:Uncharacterized protein n=1 Tax=Salvia splendens TaxID=180675 RepID=A0A8X8W1G6_SALSN|nr:hypothetical protein SASPL_155261 [Salvia splendens]